MNRAHSNTHARARASRPALDHPNHEVVMLLARPIVVFVAALLLSLAAFAPVATAWSPDPAVNTPVCTFTGDQWGPVSVTDGSGGSIVAWYDWRSGNADVYAQRFDAIGAAQWTDGGVLVCNATGDQTEVRIVSDGAGGAIVTWQDSRGGATKIYAQRLNSAGVAQWTANGVSMGTVLLAVAQTHPAIVATGSATCVITWEQSGDIVAQRLTAAGALNWGSAPLAVCNATGTQQSPVAAYDPTPGSTAVYFVWRDDRSGTSDLYMQRITTAAVVAWTANGLALCNAASDQIAPVVQWDRTIGLVASWMDHRSGNYDIYVQAVGTTGAVSWTANGVPVCAAALDQWYPRLVTGGIGKMVVGWEDWRTGSSDVYAQLVFSTGIVQWTANGVALCSRSGNQTAPVFAADGSGGVIGAWQDQRSTVQLDVYAQRLNATGVAQWTADGVAISSAIGDQLTPFVQQLSGSNAVVYWQDRRGATRDVYAQGVDGWGALGAAPQIVSVRDVPNDQGAHVVLRFDASVRDAFPYDEISVYRIYARAPGAASYSLVDSVQAAELPGYSRVLYTTRDSSAASNVRTAFRVDAYSVSTAHTYASEVDSGYSVDDLAPPPPANLEGTYAAGVATLSWSASDAGDLAGYRVWRVHGAAEQCVATVRGTSFVDAVGVRCAYRVEAVDSHDNVTSTAIVTLTDAAAADGVLPTAVALSRPEPNPAAGAVALRLSLPRGADLRARVLDAQGRVVRTLANGTFAAGVHLLTWDGFDGGGRETPAGVYFVSVQTGCRTLVRRLVRVR